VPPVRSEPFIPLYVHRGFEFSNSRDSCQITWDFHYLKLCAYCETLWILFIRHKMRLHYTLDRADALIMRNIFLPHQTPNVLKRQHYPCNRPWSPQGCKMSRFPHFLDNRLTDGGEILSFMWQPPFNPRNIPGTHFCRRLSWPQGHSAAGMIR
jgi:hypothetical protein